MRWQRITCWKLWYGLELTLLVVIASSCKSKVKKLRKWMKMGGGEIIIGKQKTIQRGGGW
jgi:hypothetical protein